MERLNKFEKDFLFNGRYKKHCEDNHKIIERKYIEIFGNEDYEMKKKQVKKDVINHCEVLTKISSKNKEMLEKYQESLDYLYILPYAKKQILYFYKKQGIECNSINDFLRLCQE